MGHCGSNSPRDRDVTARIQDGSRDERKRPLNPLNLITAMAVGGMIGLAGHALMPTRHTVNRLLPVAVGAVAAVSGTLAAWLADHSAAALTPITVAQQSLFAAIAVAVVAARTNRPRNASRD